MPGLIRLLPTYLNELTMPLKWQRFLWIKLKILSGHVAWHLQNQKPFTICPTFLVNKYGGKVPNTFEELEALPGVGHKTASVVMSQAFGFSAFPVDTHIHRLAYRWGLSSGKNVTQTERDLKRLFPEETWNRLHLQIIYFGREYCPARSHDFHKCPICSKYGRKSLLK